MECQVSNSKHWDLDIKCSAFSIVCQMLVVKYRAVNSKNISDIKYQQLQIDYWILTIRYLLTTRCYAFDIQWRVLCIDYQILNIPTPVYLLLVFILLSDIKYQQLQIDYWILTIRYLLTTRCYAFDIQFTNAKVHICKRQTLNIEYGVSSIEQ